MSEEINVSFNEDGFYIIFRNHNNRRDVVKFFTFESIKEMEADKYGWGFYTHTNEKYINCFREEIYDSIMKEWFEYRTKKSNYLKRKFEFKDTLKGKIDKLLDSIDVLPGGEEYEKVKLNFEENCK